MLRAIHNGVTTVLTTASSIRLTTARRGRLLRAACMHRSGEAAAASTPHQRMPRPWSRDNRPFKHPFWVLMPEERVELSRGCPRGILSPLRLPFRHSGARLVLRRYDSLDVPLLREHALCEVEPLLDIGEPSLHILERVQPCLYVVTSPHPLLQLF